MEATPIYLFYMNLNTKLIILLLFIFLFSCSSKIEAPNSVDISDNISVKKTYYDKQLGCTIYLPHSKDGSIIKQMLYFVYYENENFIVRGEADNKTCL